MIAIIDYGAGNIRSVQNMLKALALPARIVREASALEGAERIILPGVGHFDQGMEQLEARGLISGLHTMVTERGVPLLGICLGAQLIARSSEEGVRPGLGWVAADVVAFNRDRIPPDLRVPHMGWAETWVASGAAVPSIIQWAVPKEARFYFVHSFHLVCDNPKQSVLRAWHGYEFTAGVVHGNVLGMQFHPEKSHDFGKAILQAFANWTPEVLQV